MTTTTTSMPASAVLEKDYTGGEYTLDEVIEMLKKHKCFTEEDIDASMVFLSQWNDTLNFTDTHGSLQDIAADWITYANQSLEKSALAFLTSLSQSCR